MRPLNLLCVVVSGGLFGFGLTLATMVQPEVVLSFLRFADFGLVCVLGAATTVTLITYQLAPKLLRHPLFAESFGVHPSIMDSDTLAGAAIFGIGWGICGVCPGPAIAGLGSGNWPLLLALAGMFAGAYAQGWLANRRLRNGEQVMPTVP